MKLIIVNLPQEEEREAIEREKIIEREELQKKAEKLLDKKIVIKPNEAFTKIQSDLVCLGWIYTEKFLNYVESPESASITESPSIKLVTEKFNITIIPHDNGIEISRLEVWEGYQGHGYASLFLDNLLRFFLNKGIVDIFVLPGHAGIGKSRDSLAYNTNALQGFYQKRGFQRLENSLYWKLISTNSIDINRFDPEILTNEVI